MLINVTRPVPDTCVDFVATHEAEGGVPRLTAYPDPGSGGDPWTIGFGSTRGVRPGMTITAEEARTRLLSDLEDAAERLEQLIGGSSVQELTMHQYSAMISFVYNIKVNPKDHIWQYLRDQHFDLIPGELIKFVWAAGKKMQGLVNRRTDEIRLWSTAEPGIIDAPVTTAALGDTSSPPTPGPPPTPLGKANHWIAGCAATCLTAASSVAPTIKGGLDQAQDAITPYVGHSTILAGISDHLALAAAAMSALTLVLMWMSHQKAKTA